MPRAQGKILVIRGGAIGDFILTLPVFAALRAQFPQTPLEALAYPHIGQLALAGGLVDQVRSIEARALAGFFARNGSLDPQLCEYFAGFAVVVSYLYDPDEIFQANVARCAQAQFIPGPHRPDEQLSLHATQVFLKPLERLAIFNADPVPRLIIQSNGLCAGPLRSNNPNELRLALHPGSGSESKNWPEKKWAELLERLISETPWKFLLVGGEVEGDRIARLAPLLPPERVVVAQKLDLGRLAASLQKCDLFIGHDSGISHLAAAVGLRVLALWGGTNPAIWHPRGDHISVLRSEKGLAHLEVGSVLDALLRLKSTVS